MKTENEKEKKPLDQGWGKLFDWGSHSGFEELTEGPQQEQVDGALW